MTDPSAEDCYALLGVGPSATAGEIREAYWRGVGEYDAQMANGAAATRLEELNRAYETLGQPSRRAAYDRQRGRQLPAGPAGPWPGLGAPVAARWGGRLLTALVAGGAAAAVVLLVVPVLIDLFGGGRSSEPERFRQVAGVRLGPNGVCGEAAAVQRVVPSVVRVVGRGSGFIVSSEGHILTSQRVVEDARELTVALSDGRTFVGHVVGSSALLGLAMMQIDGANGLQPIVWGNAGGLAPEAPVIAVGYRRSPDKEELTTAVGDFSGWRQADSLLLTAVNIPWEPDLDGAPLVNACGEVVGMMAPGFLPGVEGVSFALPAEVAHPAAEALAFSR